MTFLKTYLNATPIDEVDSATAAYLGSLDQISSVSPKIAESILQELHDQRTHLKLIASENYSSLPVQLAMGNLLTDKYAEGYPHHRFYAGCDNVDTIEQTAADELKQIFGCDHAYVQPHSGADANLVAFWSIIVHNILNKEIEKLGKKSVDQLTAEEHETIRQLMVNQKVMGLSLRSGGHLTHGFALNVTSMFMKACTYDVDRESELINFDHLAKQIRQEKPTILLAGYSSYPRKINFAKMKELADEVGAVFMVDMAHFAGLVAGKVFTGAFDPIPFADFVTTTTHKTLRGPRGGVVMCKKEFAETVNKGCPLILGGPLPHVMAAKAIAFKEANTKNFCNYAQNIVNNAQSLAQAFLAKDCKLVTGGTDNHLLVLNVSQFGLTGRQAETALSQAGITVNRNTVPFDPNGAWYTSGIRIGTPATTTLGMGSNEMQQIADLIFTVLSNTKPTFVAKTNAMSKAQATVDNNVLISVQNEVKKLMEKFPLYPQIAIPAYSNQITI